LELIKEIGAFAGLVAFLGLALLALLSFAHGRDIRRLREWAGSAPERDAGRKESTSVAAQQRAEEMRKLEEAREEERRAADLRETRRQRRESGLPELTRAERLRSQLGDPRYLVAIFLVLVLVAGAGVYLATRGSSGSAKDGRQAAAKVKPSEIEVSVLNGTAVPGLAATYGNKVEQHGFQLGTVTNSSSSFTESVVMFMPHGAAEAHRVAAALGISRVRSMSSDISSAAGGAQVAVVVGEEDASSAG
jgi:hypothetical protein